VIIPLILRQQSPAISVVDTTGTTWIYDPQQSMTGYQAGVCLKIVFSFNMSSQDFESLWKEVYAETAEHWKKVEVPQS
jgi:hypothetical protein